MRIWKKWWQKPVFHKLYIEIGFTKRNGFLGHLLNAIFDIQSLTFIKKAYLKGPSTPRGYNIRAKILVPPNAHLFKLPVLVHVYAGPGYNYVTNDFNVGWDQFLVTNRSVAVVFIDGRGSGSSGNQQRFAVNRKLGKYEIIDQLQVDTIRKYRGYET